MGQFEPNRTRVRPRPRIHAVNAGGRRVSAYADVSTCRFGCLSASERPPRPRDPDVPGDEHELGEVEQHVVEVRDRPPRLGRPQRARVPDLRAEGHAVLDAGDVDRVEAPVVGRQPPQPGQRADGTKPSSPTQRRISRTPPMGSWRSTEATPRRRSGAAATKPATSSLEISAPRGPCQALRSASSTPAASIAASELVERRRPALLAGPAQQRGEPGLGHEPVRGLLRPRVDDPRRGGHGRRAARRRRRAAGPAPRPAPRSRA